MRRELVIAARLLLFSLLWPVVMLFGTVAALADDRKGML